MTDIFEKEHQQLNEVFSFSSVMDVKELRLLYYGRIDLYVTFTDDGELSMEPSSDENRPYAYVAHPVNDVVASKVKTSEFYANVYRVNKQNDGRKIIEDIRQYDSKQLERDKEKLFMLEYFEPSTVREIINSVSVVSTLRSKFDVLWEITERLSATKGRYAKQYWRRIFLDLGYNAVKDPQGSGKLIKKKYPVMLQFDRDIMELDIVPIQKFKKDPRSRTASKVNRMVKKMAIRRNQVAKRRFTTREVEDDTNKMYYDMLGKFMEYL